MSTPLITWGCIVGLFITIMIVKGWRAVRYCSRNKEKLLGLMSEREEFYIPGDPKPRTNRYYDYEDFDDI